MRSRRLSVTAIGLAMCVPTSAARGQPSAEPAGIAAAPDFPCPSLIPSPASYPKLTPDTFQLLAGYLVDTGIGPNPQWPLDYVPVSARIGWYCTDPLAPAAISLQFDYTTGFITRSFGHFLTGPSVLVRFEWRPDRVLVPYVQLGPGMFFNDAYQNQLQSAIGSVREFNLEAGGGLHYRFNPKWSLDTEVKFQHISNGDSARRNGGINDLGFLVGFSYTFDGR